MVSDLSVGQAQTGGDPDLGATVFLFQRECTFVTSELGGAVASYCTNEVDLFDDKSTSTLHKVDAIFFSGGSLHGLAVGGGVAEYLSRKAVEEKKMTPGTDFYYIPRVSGAITFAGAWGINTEWVPPTPSLGLQACASARRDWTPKDLGKGQTGAGTNCWCGVIHGTTKCYPGGQGCATANLKGSKVECVAYVVLNCIGDVRQSPDYKGDLPPSRNRFQSSNVLVHTNVKFASLHHMQQIAKQIHCSMANEIVPFACCADGDILFLSSSENVKLDADTSTAQLGMFMSSVISQAIKSVFD